MRGGSHRRPVAVFVKTRSPAMGTQTSHAPRDVIASGLDKGIRIREGVKCALMCCLAGTHFLALFIVTPPRIRLTDLLPSVARQRTLGLVQCCSVVLAMALTILLFLPTGLLEFRPLHPDRPGLSLPVASGGMRISIDPAPLELSVTPGGDRAATRFGVIGDLETFLVDSAAARKEIGWAPILRVRIPRDAPARFIRDVAIFRQRAGIWSLYIAVDRMPEPAPPRVNDARRKLVLCR